MSTELRTALRARSTYLVGAASLALLTACGGGSTVEVGTPPAGPEIAGQVSMPNGAVAAAPSWIGRLAQAAVARVEALVAGNVEAVGAGVEVRLYRIDAASIVDGQIRNGAPLSRVTTNADGRYSVRLPFRTSPDTCRFLLEVGSSAQRSITRAFVYADRVDINFESEATLRLLLEQIDAGAVGLCDVSTADIQLVTDAVVSSTRQVFGDSAAAINSSAVVAAQSDPAVQAAIEQAVGAPTPVPPATNTRTPRATASATGTGSQPTATSGMPPTRTSGVPPTRTETSVPTETSGPPPTRTATAVATATNTGQVPTATATVVSTNTAGPTNTVAATSTATPTGPEPTSTAVATTPTATSTVAAPTNTAVPSTATAVSTNTAAATLTATAAATPTAPVAAPQINLSAVATTAGATVSVPVTLVTNGAQIAAVSNDIEYDADEVDVAAGVGGPDCTIDNRLDGVKQVVAGVTALSGGRKRLRVGIVGTDNNELISSGPLYSCRFVVAMGAPVMVILDNTPDAADAQANPVAVEGSDGRIDVAAAPPSLGLTAGTVATDGTVTLTASLNARGQALAAVSTDIAFDPGQLAVVDADQNGAPDCTVIAEIAALGKEVFAAQRAGVAESVLRVGLIATGNNTALPDTGGPVPLFECRFDVQASGTTIVVEHAPEGAGPGAQAVALLGEPGTITAP